MSSGWRAECWSCPTSIGTDYSETVRVGAEFSAVVFAKSWAILHTSIHQGHVARVTQFSRVEITVTDVNPELMALLFGP